MEEVKRITIPVDSALKTKLEKIAAVNKRSFTSNLAYGVEVFAALFDDEGRMKCSIDSILLGQVPIITQPNFFNFSGVTQSNYSTASDATQSVLASVEDHLEYIDKEKSTLNADKFETTPVNPDRVRAKKI